MTLSGASSNPFADMTNHWARTYTARLSELGIISGITSGDVTNFYPNRNITRGDFALMAANWLGLDLNAYASVSLPYTDTKDIPSWDLNAVKALYELGIMQGSRANDGTLRANARASITRAEAMTILGRHPGQGLRRAGAHLLRRGAGARLGGRLPQESGGPGCDHRQRQPHPPQRSAHPRRGGKAALRHAVKDG